MEEIKETVNEHACTTCGGAFLMSDDHEKWYEKMELKIPKRCPICIQRRKDIRSANAGGQNEN